MLTFESFFKFENYVLCVLYYCAHFGLLEIIFKNYIWWQIIVIIELKVGIRRDWNQNRERSNNHYFYS